MADIPTVTAGQPGIQGKRRRSPRRWLEDVVGYPQADVSEKAILYPAAPDKGTEPDAQTIDFVYESVQHQIEAQQNQATTLESKAVTVLGSASLLTASATALQAVVGSRSGLSRHSFSVPVRAVQFAALVAYVFIVLCCAFAYRVRAYTETPDPRTIRKYFFDDVTYIKRVLIGNMVGAFARNQITVDRKAWWTKKALWGLVLEGVLLAAAALLQILQ